MLVLIEQVAWVQSSETIRVLLEIFALLAGRTLSRPAEHLLVSVHHISSIEVLQEGVQVAIVDHTSVVVVEDRNDLGSVRRLSNHSLGFGDGPKDSATEHLGNRNQVLATDGLDLLTSLLLSHNWSVL